MIVSSIKYAYKVEMEMSLAHYFPHSILYGLLPTSSGLCSNVIYQVFPGPPTK